MSEAKVKRYSIPEGTTLIQSDSGRWVLASDYAASEAEVRRLRDRLDRLVETYDRLFDNDPRGRAVEFESALAAARAALTPPEVTT